jgi:two-component system cell cycle sensor histidine kinase/response regulator CckA
MSSRRDTAKDALSALAGRRTVLVVDDEQPVRELIAVMLELEGLRVLQADCGAAALEIAATEELALITLDVMMPDLDGWQVADALDASERTARVPRVMVSGKPLVELESAPGRERASAVLTKPFDFAEFTTIVQTLLAAPPVPPARPAMPRQRLSAEAGSERLYGAVQSG